jgi:hypothetical protein
MDVGAELNPGSEHFDVIENSHHCSMVVMVLEGG